LRRQGVSSVDDDDGSQRIVSDIGAMNATRSQAQRPEQLIEIPKRSSAD
jgi:hypothetical protein